MLSRIDSEKREYDILSKYAAKAADSKGRAKEEDKCDFRTDFQRDRDRIIHSKALRRLMHKTQVFLSPEGDHYRTRLTHTLEVAQLSKSIARGLLLNEDLTEAIAMGHDLGHTPFGHNGEHFLNIKHKAGFKHNVQSLRVVDILEGKNEKRGINLTMEVRDGILNHTGSVMPFTLEGQIVKISDRVAYINHDIDDAIRSGVISESDLPADAVAILGHSTKDRINSLVTDLIESSDGRDIIMQSEACAEAMDVLRTFMFEHVYFNPIVKREEELEKIGFVINTLYDYYLENTNDLPEEYQKLIPEFGKEEIVKDHIAGMTDRYAIDTFEKRFVPTGWQKNK